MKDTKEFVFSLLLTLALICCNYLYENREKEQPQKQIHKQETLTQKLKIRWA